jgi:hypothetical protein
MFILKNHTKYRLTIHIPKFFITIFNSCLHAWDKLSIGYEGITFVNIFIQTDNLFKIK